MNGNMKIMWNGRDITKFESPFGNFEVVVIEDLGPVNYGEKIRNVVDELRKVRLVYALETTKNVFFEVRLKANEVKFVVEG